MTTCLKCGYKRQTSDTAPETDCPKCGAIYAKVHAAANNGRRPPPIATKRSPLPWVLAGLALLAGGGVYGYSAFDKHQRHQAALAHCGAVAHAKWEGEFKAAVAEFDRAADAAKLSPRMTLAPMLLRMSEAKAKVAAVPAVPCADAAAKAMVLSMDYRIKAFELFALQRPEQDVANAFELAQAAGSDAAGMLAEVKKQLIR
jgi:predicted  nucleic acid-binding Zn-ribbon protein